MQKSKIYLPDINVWLAIAADGHIHHKEATAWFETTGPVEAAFCRITQMGFLRLLTNAHAMHEDVRSQKEAWRVFDRLRDDERVMYLAEPEGLEGEWRSATQHPSPSNHLWTDCYLHAFAAARQAIVVTFDRTRAKSAGVQPLLLGRPRSR
jgi:toxin-antitoxin system PIN domain toxin